MATSKLAADISALQAKFKVLKKTEFRGETTLTVDEPDAILEVLPFCQGASSGFTPFLVDISGIDNFGEEPRFELAYEMLHFERYANTCG